MLAVTKQNTETPTRRVASTEEHVEEILRGNIGLKVPIFWSLSGRVRPLVTTLVVLSPFAGVAQHSVRIANSCKKEKKNTLTFDTPVDLHFHLCRLPVNLTFKCIRGAWSVILVRMELQSQLPVGSFEFVL